MTSDDAIIRHSFQDPSAFGSLFERHGSVIYRYVARRIGRETAEDVMSETFLTAFRSRSRFDLKRTDARLWLFGIANNLIRRHFAAESRRFDLIAAAPAEHIAVDAFELAEDRLDAMMRVGGLGRALAALSRTDRETLLLYAWGDLDYEGVAEATGVVVGTVKSSRTGDRFIKNHSCSQEGSRILLHGDPHARNERRRSKLMDELTLLKSIDHDIEGPRAFAMQQTRTLLAAAFSEGGSPRRLHPARRWLISGAGFSLAAAVTAALVVMNLSGGVSIPGLPQIPLPIAPASATEVLLQTASLSESATDPIVGPDQYLRITSNSEQIYTNVVRGAIDGNRIARWGWLERTESQLYIAADPASEWVWVLDTTPESPGGQVLQSWGEGAAEAREEMLSQMYGAYPDEDLVVRFHDGFLKTREIFGGMLSPRFSLIDSMPPDPGDLLTWYRQQAKGTTGLTGDAAAFELMATDLQWNLFPATKRGQIWRAMAEIPGILVSQRGTSATGHSTVTIGLPSAVELTPDDAIDDAYTASLREITIDTTTGTLLSRRMFVPSPLTAEGTPLYPSSTPWWSTTFSTQVVDHAP